LISEDVLKHAVELACTAHTRLVHIHPFSDGNGRLSRLISGLILQIVGLPMPMLLREDRYLYISAVGDATIHLNYSSVCNMFYIATKYSINSLISIANEVDGE
jgi:fido (protein-threonine AMPylation protein)